MTDSMLKLYGNPFSCECGCNVFRELERYNGVVLYSCNACGMIYEGVAL